MKPPLSELEGHRGYVAPRYSRGLRTTRMLLESGRRLLRQHPLDQVTINQLCAHAKVTTGAFYSRFDSKESYFKALQTLVLAELRSAIAARIELLDSRPWGLREALEMLTRNTRLWAYRHEGVLRASLIQRAHDGDDPFKQLNQDYLEQAVPRIARLHPAGSSPALELRIRFAFQIMMGTLVFALVNHGGIYNLNDRRLEQEMARSFYQYITQELETEQP
ncbi:TetR/AcrR family transcriptional regulator [Pseudomonas cavernae]|uniref:TetR/AcrR family transcriptional regulator n=1 Tax=Pseudomonas cavernae TaxID=2320867 RepID=A0A385Z3A5_9PSED|nr:TetR/AcrR family transcriptional regulator [Pseudomonas cavernae]AYC33745.1 TetR/AcrR family transcriptional regulator [Pseudomonas cavernae]